MDVRRRLPVTRFLFFVRCRFVFARRVHQAEAQSPRTLALRRPQPSADSRSPVTSPTPTLNPAVLACQSRHFRTDWRCRPLIQAGQLTFRSQRAEKRSNRQVFFRCRRRPGCRSAVLPLPAFRKPRSRYQLRQRSLRKAALRRRWGVSEAVSRACSTSGARICDHASSISDSGPLVAFGWR